MQIGVIQRISRQLLLPNASIFPRSIWRVILGAFVLLSLSGPGVLAQNAPSVAPKSAANVPFAGFGSNSREPVKINANQLEVVDKENRAVYSGDVVAVQGQTNLRCSVLTVFYTQAAGQAAPATANAQNSIKKIDCVGPVSVLTGTQSITSKHAIYEAASDKITMNGAVVISDGDNVQRGERVVYDVKTGIATVDAGGKGRVQGIFVPGNAEDRKKDPN
jgi:lipopolysaccharide export system protein LptA